MRENHVDNQLKNVLRKHHRRSRSLDAVDNLEVLEAQRIFRQRYLQNRAKFERGNEDTTDSGRQVNEKIVPRSRRFSTEAEQGVSTVLKFATDAEQTHRDVEILKAPSLVREVSSKYVTSVHRSMLDPQEKELPSDPLTQSLPPMGGSRTTPVRRTLSAREESTNWRDRFSVNGVGTLPPKSTRTPTRSGSVTSSPFLNSDRYFTRKQTDYNLASRIVSDPGTSKAAVNNINKKSSLFMYLRDPFASGVDPRVTQNDEQGQQGGTVSDRTSVDSKFVIKGEDKNEHPHLRLYSSDRQGPHFTGSGSERRKDADVSVTQVDSSTGTRLPQPFSSFKTEMQNKVWKPVPVHRHNSFNNDIRQGTPKTKNIRTVTRTRSDLDKYSQFLQTNKQNTVAVDSSQNQLNQCTLPLIAPRRGNHGALFVTPPANRNNGTLPLTASTNGKISVKSRDETLPSTLSLNTQFRKFNLP